jgi:hypothetical protein
MRPGHVLHILSERELGLVLLAKGELKEAVACLQRASERIETEREETLGEQSPLPAAIQFELAKALQRAGAERERIRRLLASARERFRGLEAATAKERLAELERWSQKTGFQVAIHASDSPEEP